MMSENLLSNRFANLLCATLMLLVVGCGRENGTKTLSAGSGDSSGTSAASPSGTDRQQQTDTDIELVPATSPDTDIVRSTAEDLPKPKPKSTGPEVVSFDDLKIGMEPDATFRPIMLTVNDGRVKELFGERIIVGGFMEPTDTMKGVKDFILLRNLECKFGPGGQADHLVRIFLAEGQTTAFTDKTVYVEGKLNLNPYPGDPQAPTRAIYDMVDATVSTRAPSRAR